MKDYLKENVYDALTAREEITSQVGTRIKFYEYPSPRGLSGPVIIIDPLDVPLPSEFADNRFLYWDVLFQVDVWSYERLATASLMQNVTLALWEEGLLPAGGVVDEWDRETGVFRQATRFRGKIRRTDL